MPSMSFRGLPGFHVLPENLLDFFLLEPLLFPDNFSLVADIFQLSEAAGLVNFGHLVHFTLTL